MATTAELYESLSSGDATGRSRTPSSDKPWFGAPVWSEEGQRLSKENEMMDVVTSQENKARLASPTMFSPSVAESTGLSEMGKSRDAMFQATSVYPALQKTYSPSEYKEESNKFIESARGNVFPPNVINDYEKLKSKESILKSLYPQRQA
jgi:hypothetical protein